jgi:thiosulfate/3-mercaptopyruvate sulfurtransferase
MPPTDRAGSTCDFLIEADELRACLHGVTLIDARTEQAHAAAHIPGACFLSTYHCFVPDTTPEGMASFAADVVSRYAAIGVAHDRPVVVYEDETGMRAARELWILQYLGHRNVRMLHGGLRAWQALGASVESGPTVARPGGFAARAPLAGFVSIGELLADLGGDARSIVDVRDATEYAGEDDTVCCERRGRIPGASWLEWTDLLEGGRYKAPNVIRDMLRARGLSPDSELVPYCHRGARSANTYFALRYAGCPRVRNFIGSFHEWSAHRGAPVEA